MNFINFLLLKCFCKRKIKVMDTSPILLPLFDLSLDVVGELQLWHQLYTSLWPTVRLEGITCPQARNATW